MSIPKLYSVLPMKDGLPNTEVLTSHSSEIITGSDGEKFVVLSYFPRTLKYSKLSNFVLNKYVLFVLNESESKNYSVIWEFDLLDNGTSVLGYFLPEEILGAEQFEFSLGLKDINYPEISDWELTLKIKCTVFENGDVAAQLDLEQTILPIEADLLSENPVFDDESGHANSSVYLGNEETTHFVRGHLSEYLVAKKESLNPSAMESPNNAAEFVNQTAAIVYNKILGSIDTLKPEINILTSLKRTTKFPQRLSPCG